MLPMYATCDGHVLRSDCEADRFDDRSGIQSISEIVKSIPDDFSLLSAIDASQLFRNFVFDRDFIRAFDET